MNRKEVARLVVKPIFEKLLQSHYDVTYPVQIQKHLIEGSREWAGGDFLDGTAQQYEILFKKLKVKMITEYEFVRNLDDLLTQFMLLQLKHKEGEQSPTSIRWLADVAVRIFCEQRKFESYSIRSTP